MTGAAAMELRAPFPWFGGKSRVADLVWRRFGAVDNYIEPFFGSGAVLLGRPDPGGGIETVNDKDGLVANFWRALQADPDGVAHWADWPVNENDLHARHAWLVRQRKTLTARLEGDPTYYDVQIAGWWVWGLACWIGGGWCSGNGPWQVDDAAGQLVHRGNAAQGVQRRRVHLGDAGRGVQRRLVHLGDGGQGVQRRRVHLGNAGRGVQRQRVHLGNAGQGVQRQRVHLGDGGQGVSGLVAWMQTLAERLRFVRVCCGDWTRICGPTPTVKQGLTGVFLDPPYADDERDPDLYATDAIGLSAAVRAWAIDHGNDPLMRIALCGYDTEHSMPETWDAVPWKASGGYGSRGDCRGRVNAGREVVWFSPTCLSPAQQTLPWDGSQRLASGVSDT